MAQPELPRPWAINLWGVYQARSVWRGVKIMAGSNLQGLVFAWWDSAFFFGPVLGVKFGDLRRGSCFFPGRICVHFTRLRSARVRKRLEWADWFIQSWGCFATFVLEGACCLISLCESMCIWICSGLSWNRVTLCFNGSLVRFIPILKWDLSTPPKKRHVFWVSLFAALQENPPKIWTNNRIT